MNPIQVVYDPERIFQRGAEFPRQEFAITLWLGCWPEGMVVWDPGAGRRYEVRPRERKPRQQMIVTLDGLQRLAGKNNGNLYSV